jgi:hypothetical protein
VCSSNQSALLDHFVAQLPSLSAKRGCVGFVVASFKQAIFAAEKKVLVVRQVVVVLVGCH